MEAISLKLPQSLLEESRRNAQALKMSRSEYSSEPSTTVASSKAR
jgi:hypothetical protein